MADRVFFVAGSPDELIRGVSVPQQMISDLLQISRIPPPVIEQIGASVEGAGGFLDDTRLEKLVKEVIPEDDETAADAVVNAVRNLRSSSLEEILNALEEWRRADARHLETFPDEAFASVRRVLPRLIRPSAALDRQREAGRLRATPVESAEAEAEGADPDSRCRAIVESLRRPDLEHEERRKLILKAEVLPFRGQHAAALVPLLRQFIETYRESNVPADLVAVGSAIRNYVATAASDDAFEAAASLLKAQGRLPIPIELEVEVTKMVVRKLTANPPMERDQYTELALRLEELVDAYARPRFLAREKYGAVALNAVLGLVLTRSGRDAEVLERMRTLDVPWFQQLLARRAARLRADLLSRESGAKFADIARVLGQLSDRNPSTLAS